MSDGKNFFDQPINSNLKTYENIRKLLLIKEMITRLDACCIILTLKIITNQLQ